MWAVLSGPLFSAVERITPSPGGPVFLEESCWKKFLCNAARPSVSSSIGSRRGAFWLKNFLTRTNVIHLPVGPVRIPAAVQSIVRLDREVLKN